MIKRSIYAIIGIGIVGCLGFLALAWRPAIAPITPPAASSFSPTQIAAGQTLTGAGYCAVCHTKAGGQPYTGGYALKTPFGTIYSPNITPDPDTGIGNWSETAFARAMHSGIARDGAQLFPAFPYDHFTQVSDADVSAIYAYLMTRPAVSAPTIPNTIPFPLNIRLFQEGWKILYFHPGRFQPNPSQSAELNRGAYLAEGLSHCGGCHTPRNALGAEETSDAYAGAMIDGWNAPALNSANPSPAAWTQAEMFAYLRNGISPLHGAAAGPMSPVIHVGLSQLPDADINAIALYYAGIANADARQVDGAQAVTKALATSARGTANETNPDARLYAAACGYCHYNAASGTLATRPELALSSALALPQPNNFINVVLHGIGLHDGGPGLFMPGFADALNDSDIARIAVYLRATRTDQPAWTGVQNQVTTLRAQ